MSAYDSVLMIAFGGPERPEEIRPFLDGVLRGRPVGPGRLESVAHHYELIGGRSPLNDLTSLQARALQAELARCGPALPVHLGMVHWKPWLVDTVRALVESGKRRAVGVIMAAHRTEASWEKYLNAFQDALAQLGRPAFEWEPIGPWHADPLFIEAVAAGIPGEDLAESELVFTAHSVPQGMSDRSGYAAQVTESARAVAERLGHARWSVAWQSRSGRPEDPWVGPGILEHLRALSSRGVRSVIVVPIGFLCDHVEVLYDLDREANLAAQEHKMRFRRAPTVGCHAAFIRLLAERVRRLVE